MQRLENPVNSTEVRRKRTIVLACLQCRSRKVRCDAGQPKCGHCTKRLETCEYVERKIRGPDRQPGTRVRKFWKKPETHIESQNSPARKRTKDVNHSEEIGVQALGLWLASEAQNGILESFTPSSDVHDGSASSERSIAHLATSASATTLSLQAADPNTWINLNNGQSYSHFLCEIPGPNTSPLQSAYFATQNGIPTPLVYNLDYIPRGPSIVLSKDIWWDSLLQLYGPDRLQSSREITQDITLLFDRTIYWTSFMNLPIFFEKLYNPLKRPSLQPSLVLSALAFSTLMQSSETNMGDIGRQRALLLRDAAQSSLEASISAGWIDHSLVQAALLLTIFEGSPHPYHTPDRTTSALSLLDSLIYSLGLLLIDVHEPTVSIFPADEAPTIGPTTPFRASETLFPPQLSQHDHFSGFYSALNSPYRKDACLQESDEDSDDWAIGRSWRLMFKPPNWPDIQTQGKGEIEKEEVRRLCWNALSVATIFREHMSHFQRCPWNFHILKQENFAIFFPEESKYRSDNNTGDLHSLGPKDTMWALHCRGMLLWNLYFRFREYPDGDPKKAELSTRILRETVSIESGLVPHTQSLGKRSFYLMGDFLFRIKAVVSNDRSCCAANFHMRNGDPNEGPYITGATSMAPGLNLEGGCRCAKAWKEERNEFAAGIRRLVDTVFKLGSSASLEMELTKTPLSIWWTTSKIKGGIECWTTKPTFKFALEQSWEFVALADFLLGVWPSPSQKNHLLKLKGELIEACLVAGVAIPPSLPIPGLKPQYEADMIITSPIWQSQPNIPHLVTSSASSAAVIPILPVD